jgi:CHAT domain-containing protein/Flp pilus assembly protein TadD
MTLMKRSFGVAFFLCGFLVVVAQTDSGPSSEIDRQVQTAAGLFEKGRTADSKKIYQALLVELCNRPPSSQLGFVLNGLSKVAAAEGEYKSALQLAIQSGDIYRHVGDAGGESHSLNNQGIAEIQMGQYQPAQRTLETALLLSQRAQDTENQVQILNNLGSSYYFRGSYSEAMRGYDAALTLVEQNSGAKWSDYWRQITNFNQATLLQRLGRYEKALQIYREVDHSSKSLTPSDRAHLYANFGALYRRLGDPYKALDTYRAAQKLYSEQHDAGGELTVLKNIGIVYALDMEDLSQAEKIFGSAIVLAQNTNNRREEMQAHLYLGETLLRSDNLSPAKAEFDRAKGIASDLGTAEEQWKSLYGLGKIAEQNSDLVAAEEDYRQAIAIIEKARSQLQLSALRTEFFADKREAYDALLRLLFAKNDLRGTFSFLERSRARNFQDRLHGQDGDALQPTTLDASCAALRPATTLLEYWTSNHRIGVVWCTQTSSGMTSRTLSSQEMKQIRDLVERMPGNLSADWQEQFRILKTLLPDDPTVFRDVRHLIIVPDGWISYVPFDLLAARNADAALIEDYDISYLPTAVLLRRLQPSERLLRFPWTEELVGFGDPTMASEEMAETSGEPERQSDRPLRFSGQEILNIARLARGRSRLFLQHNDVRKSFLSPAANRAFLLHVSTHAFADADNPENSRLLFSPEGSGGDPDYVFLRELYELDLSNVRLATISACDTERGKIVRGEGVQAFSRALLSAGAASSLTTLWPVDDEQSSEFMKQFYYFLIHEHMPKAEALRVTKLQFFHSNEKLAAPRLWAAFILNGDGATSIPFVLSWSEVVVLSVGFVIVVAIAAPILLRCRRRVNREHGSCALVS